MASGLIGILADSHGRTAALAAAISDLRDVGCETIVHLGDICDSAHPETADACVSLLRERDVLGVLGNNDHALLVNRTGRIAAAVSPATLAYLERLPLVIVRGAAVFAHSLPFAQRLGAACMIRDLDPDEARLFCERYPRQVLFRGHAHAPALSWVDAEGALQREDLAPGQILALAAHSPCIVTCGALERGFTMTWSPSSSSATCRRARSG